MSVRRRLVRSRSNLILSRQTKPRADRQRVDDSAAEIASDELDRKEVNNGAQCNLTKPEKEDTVEYRIQQSLWDGIERLQQELKEETEGRFEARVRCLEIEEKLKKLNSA